MQPRGRRGEVKNAITSSLSTRVENYRRLFWWSCFSLQCRCTVAGKTLVARFSWLARLFDPTSKLSPALSISSACWRWNWQNSSQQLSDLIPPVRRVTLLRSLTEARAYVPQFSHKSNSRTRTLGFLEWWIFFPMKLSSHCNSLCRNRQRVSYFLLIVTLTKSKTTWLNVHWRTLIII